MTEHVAAGEAREALDDLHLAAHENGPTTDLSTHFRRARRLWVTVVGEHHMAYDERVPAWDELGASMQLMLAGFVARAVQDVLEVEQVMYRALGKVLDRHVEGRPFYGHGFSQRRCECGADWPCRTVTAVTGALAGVEGEG